jgi:type IV secretion system protein VirB1
MIAIAALAAYLRACAPAVAPDTMRAIVAVESHGYSYAINDNSARVSYCVPGGHGYPCTHDRAIAIANRAVALGHSVDIGIAQVNSGNFRAYHVTATKMLEPCENLQIASAILASAYRISAREFADERQALWHAIMAYNTGSLYAGENYVRSVVQAAIPAEPVQAVPSVAILTQLASVPVRGVEVGNARGRPRATPRRSGEDQDPRVAPLLAQGLGHSDRRGDLGDTLAPALSH